tara:strand:+ start:1033 stop:1623 length:591 start_codon:yes stop_codon:yes gene_type:complete
MASKLNSEFNYRYQVIGETPWEKIKTLKGFLEGRVRAAALEKVADLKHQALVLEISHLIRIDALPHVILVKQAELLELESHLPAQTEAFELNREEIEMLKRLLAELYEIAERIPGYTDEQMFEANAANEFTVTIGKDIQAEILINGRPSPAKLRNAMSNPHTFAALQAIGLVPKEAVMLEGSNSALRIELKPKVLE